MAWLAALGGGLFVLASLVVGARLMWLARRTRGLPEFVLGGGLFLMGGLGYPLLAVAVQARGLPAGARIAMGVGNMALTVVGMSGVAWFTRRVFRPREPWAAVLLAALALGYAALALLQIVGPGVLAALDAPDHGLWANSAWLGLVAMLWAGLESVRYYRMQRRQLALGLSDPVVADRFRLWAISILCAACISGISLGLRMLGIDTAGTAAGSLVIGTLGLVTAGYMWMAFVPPKSYLERVRARSVAAPA